MSGTTEKNEIKRFSALANHWWEPAGPLASLHKLNPARIEWIEAQAKTVFGHFKGLEILDIGCGGGLAAEALAKHGAKVTGIDASAEAIDVAKAHAKKSSHTPHYFHATAEDFLKKPNPPQFDIVLLLEVLEHTPKPALLLETAARLTKPGGLVLVGGVNRTVASWLFGVVVAEFVLRWLPPGTHDWHKFLRPSEVAEMLEKNGCETLEVTGIVHDKSSGMFQLAPHNTAINYLLAVQKKKG